jgi:ribosomal protein S12 methylthiotransferase
VFTFSAEEGTGAASLPDQVPAEDAARRREHLMSRQQAISAAYHESLTGTSLEVLVEEETGEGTYAGRAWNQAPEVDGRTLLRGWADPGDVVVARITGGDAYDLEAKILT